MKVRTLSVLFAIGVCICGLQAQTTTGTTVEATRAKVSESLAKGDVATAEKLIGEAATAKLANITTFEEIRSCGFYPQETRLECAIEIKQQGGYGGPVGSFGSFEFVAFYIDWHANGFQRSDYVGSGIVHITDGSQGTNFAVYRDFNPLGGPRTSNGGGTTTTATTGPLVRVRAILSWNAPIAGPNQVPVWGNVFDFRIRLMPIR